MKYFIVLSVFLVISLHQAVSEDASSNTTQPASTGDPADQPGNQNTSNANNTSQGNQPTNTNTSMSGTSDKQKELLELMPKLADKCRDKFNSCYGDNSEVTELRGKSLSSLEEDELCEAVKKAETCLKKSDGCTDKEFGQVSEIACGAMQGAVYSLVLIGLLTVISKMISQQ